MISKINISINDVAACYIAKVPFKLSLAYVLLKYWS